MIIEYEGNTYIINKMDYETDNSLNTRSWFIAKQKPINENDFKKKSKIGKLFVNQKYLNCKYNKKITNIINEKTPKDLI